MLVQNWWFTTLLQQKYATCPPLQKDIVCDVLIVGAGMSGLSAAAELMGKGLKVVVVEKNILAGSSTGRSAGFLTPDSELELSQLVRRYGIDGANEIWQVPVKGIEYIKKNVEDYQISCDFRVQDSLFLGIGKSGWQDVQDELDCRKSVGFTNTQIYNEQELKSIISSSGFNGAVRYNETYGINALQYCQGMKSVLLDHGVEVYESTEILRIEDHTAYAHAGSVKAGQIIVSMDKMENSFNDLAKEVYHAQTFLSVSEPLSDQEVAMMFPNDQFQCWDSTLVYSYFRLIDGNRILLGGGNGASTFLPNAWYHEDIIKGVHKRFKSHFPFLEKLKFIQYWPGLIDTTRDLLPTIVRPQAQPHLHFIMGVVGLPWASFCGNFTARAVLGTANEDEHKYYEYFSDRRSFFLPAWLGGVIGKPMLFAINNGWAKYYQVDKNNLPTEKKNEF